jgi:hypothetical protein
LAKASIFPPKGFKKFNNSNAKPAIDHIWIGAMSFKLLNKIIEKYIKM